MNFFLESLTVLHHFQACFFLVKSLQIKVTSTRKIIFTRTILQPKIPHDFTLFAGILVHVFSDVCRLIPSLTQLLRSPLWSKWRKTRELQRLSLWFRRQRHALTAACDSLQSAFGSSQLCVSLTAWAAMFWRNRAGWRSRFETEKTSLIFQFSRTSSAKMVFCSQRCRRLLFV